MHALFRMIDWFFETLAHHGPQPRVKTERILKVTPEGNIEPTALRGACALRLPDAWLVTAAGDAKTEAAALLSAQTPLKIESLVFGTVHRKEANRRKQHIEAVARDRMAALCLAARAQGLRPQRMGGDALAIPVPIRLSALGKTIFVGAGLGLLLLALLPVPREQASATTITGQANDDAARSLAALLSATPLTVAYRQLLENLPETAFLERLTLADGTLTLIGRAQNADKVYTALAKQGATLVGGIETLDTGEERFTLSLPLSLSSPLVP